MPAGLRGWDVTRRKERTLTGLTSLCRVSKGLLPPGVAADEAEDEGPDEEDYPDDSQPEQALEREPDDGQDRPYDEEDHDYCQHAADGTRECGRW